MATGYKHSGVKREGVKHGAKGGKNHTKHHAEHKPYRHPPVDKLDRFDVLRLTRGDAV